MLEMMVPLAVLGCIVFGLLSTAKPGPSPQARAMLVGIALTIGAAAVGDWLANALLESERQAADRIAAERYNRLDK
jgi:hypothetical protein